MKLYPKCDLLIGNEPEEYLEEQYIECEYCYRYEICKKAFDKEKDILISNMGEQMNK